MRMSRFAVPSLLVLALGCASAPPPNVPPPVWAFASATPSSGKELRMRTQERYIQVSIEGDSIFGATWSLKHGGTYIRGFGPGQTAVQIGLKGTHAEGNIRNAPLTVDLQPRDNGVTQVSGLFGGVLSDFKISPQIFQGKLGPCSYDLAFDGKRYEGRASCNGRITLTSLELPVVMASWTDLEVATVLAIVLGN
jgi:hypothetical protein